jgi:hypothetical protein
MAALADRDRDNHKQPAREPRVGRQRVSPIKGPKDGIDPAAAKRSESTSYPSRRRWSARPKAGDLGIIEGKSQRAPSGKEKNRPVGGNNLCRVKIRIVFYMSNWKPGGCILAASIRPPRGFSTDYDVASRNPGGDPLLSGVTRWLCGSRPLLVELFHLLILLKVTQHAISLGTLGLPSHRPPRYAPCRRSGIALSRPSEAVAPGHRIQEYATGVAATFLIFMLAWGPLISIYLLVGGIVLN